MVFYFSGTGNSKWIAERVAKRLGDTATSIITAEGQSFQFTPADRVGIVFPIYAWSAPEVVGNFMQKVQAGGAYTYAIASCGEDVGCAFEALSEKFPLKSGFSIKMPDNYVVGDYQMEEMDEVEEKLRDAGPRVDAICDAILAGKEGFDVNVGPDAQKRTYEISSLFNQSHRSTAPFTVDKSLCISCGLCETNCPAKVVKLVDGAPVWEKETCYMCMACINYCPTVAIEYGKNSVGKRRYTFPGEKA